MAAARQPPPQMRDRVMAAVARTRQVAGGRGSRPARAPGAAARPFARLAMAGGALAVVAAVVLGIALVNTRHQLNQAKHQLSQAQAQLQAITAVQTATDAKVDHQAHLGGRHRDRDLVGVQAPDGADDRRAAAADAPARSTSCG